MPTKVTLQFPDEIIEKIDLFLAKTRKISKDLKVTRADLIQEAVTSYIKGGIGSKEEIRSYESLIKLAGDFKSQAASEKKTGSLRKAKKLILASIARELDALSVLDDPGEDIIKSTVIEVCLGLKEATGYKKLPEVPAKVMKIDLDSVSE